MARELHLLPRRELGIGLAQQPVDLGLEPRHLVGDVDVAAVGEVAQLLDLAFEFGKRLFEVEEMTHRARCLAQQAAQGQFVRGNAGASRYSPSALTSTSAVSSGEKFCCPVTRLPSRKAKPRQSPAWAPLG